MPRLHLPALILTFGLNAAALAGAGAVLTTAAVAAPTGPTVSIDNFTFSPPTITVGVGSTVTWVNQDDIPHTVVSTDKAFKSHVMDTDEKFSFTFTRPGEYAYFCSLHPHMVGKVVVKGG
jgi:amicyanin